MPPAVAEAIGFFRCANNVCEEDSGPHSVRFRMASYAIFRNSSISSVIRWLSLRYGM